MTQTARPISTISAGNFTPSGEATLHEATDEVVANDFTDYAVVFEAGTEIFEVKLGPMTDPASSSGHTVRVRFTDSIGYGWTFTLMQGGTPIVSWVDTTSIVNTFQDVDKALSGAETDAITDYTDLRVRCRVDGLNFFGQCYVTQIYLQAPDAAPPTPPFYDVFLWNRPDE